MKPKPIHTETVCSVCDLDWDRHDEATVRECVELLKADLAREKQRTTPQQPIPYPVPYPVYPSRPYPQNPWINRSIWISQPNFTWDSANQISSTSNLNFRNNSISGGGVYQ